DVIYGVHLWTPIPAGVVAVRGGAIMAAADEFTITVEGEGGHDGLPHEPVDSLLAGAQLAVNLQSIVSRNIDPVEPCVVSVGTFHAGRAFNVIAEQAVLTGTVRTFKEDVRQLVYTRMQEVAERTAASFGANASVHYKWGYPVVHNDAIEAERCLSVARRQFGESRVQHSQLVMAGEDFAYYLQQKPG